MKLSFSLHISFFLIIATDVSHAQSVVDQLKKTTEHIQTYSLSSQASFKSKSIQNKIIGISGKKLRVEQRFLKPVSDARSVFIFDGKMQWIDLYRGKRRSIYRIDLTRVTNAGRPFDSGYYLQDSGLLSGEDYPSTIKALLTIYTVKPTGNNRLQLQGMLNKAHFKVYSNSKLIKSSGKHIDLFMRLFPEIKLVVDAESGLVKEYSMGDSKTGNWFRVRFQEIIKGLAIDDAVFGISTSGSRVTDITDALIKQLSEIPEIN